MNTDTVRAGKILVGLLLAVVLSVQAQDTNKAAADPAVWLAYRNVSMGIEINYPKEWTLHENPGHGMIASFSFTTAEGYRGRFIIGHLTPTLSTFDDYLQQRQKHRDKRKRIPIGSESGFEEDLYYCGPQDMAGPKGGDARYLFDSRTLFSKGVTATLDIPVPNAQECDADASVDPYVLFKDEVDLARQALATLKFISQN